VTHTIVRTVAELGKPKGMPEHELLWCLWCIQSKGAATYETTTGADGMVQARCVSDNREKIWERNNDRK
jgi:hypothetical protein